MNPEEAEKRSRGISTDMSSEAISRRLEMVAELNELCRSLAASRRIVKPSGRPDTVREDVEESYGKDPGPDRGS